MSTLGIVVIGRNEGERLNRCLKSVVGPGFTVVYVDSGSSDGSVELARSLGAAVVQLDPSRPFTAARARNGGFDRLLDLDPEVRFVQFVDGDCEVVQGWLEKAMQVLDQKPEVVVVYGGLRERSPEATVYHRLADCEWNTPVGEADDSGGNAMMRVEAFRRVGGFNSALIAAEDTELCLRLRRLGGKVLRIDADMAVHDIAMTRFTQWWNRSTRAGASYAEGNAMYGMGPERFRWRETCSIVFWGILVPLAVLGLAWPTRGLSLVLIGAYWLLYRHTYRHYAVQRSWPKDDARLYARWLVLHKFPMAVGFIRYWVGRLRGRPLALVEYRDARGQQMTPESAKTTNLHDRC